MARIDDFRASVKLDMNVIRPVCLNNVSTFAPFTFFFQLCQLVGIMLSFVYYEVPFGPHSDDRPSHHL